MWRERDPFHRKLGNGCGKEERKEVSGPRRQKSQPKRRETGEVRLRGAMLRRHRWGESEDKKGQRELIRILGVFKMVHWGSEDLPAGVRGTE